MKPEAVLASFLVLAALSESASGDDPYLVRDLNATPANAASVERLQGVLFNGSFHYQADDPRLGKEPWSSDGTPEGTGVLRDVCPGDCDSAPADFTVGGGRLFFTADDGVFGREPWTSDGTAAGTRLLADIVPGPAGIRDVRGRFAAAGELLFFIADTPSATELWVSDGSRRGTRRVAWCSGCGEPERLIGAASRLYFQLRQAKPDPVVSLWVSDGTAAGTRRLVADCDSCMPLGTLGDRLLFRRRDARGTELWVSDGSAESTGLLLNACPLGCSGHPADLVVLGDVALFTAAHSPGSLQYLYITDGTPHGTEVFFEGFFDDLSGVFQLTLLGDAVYFQSFGGTQRVSTLLRLDLALRELEVVGVRMPTVENLTATADRLFFLASARRADELWTSDGTWVGTHALATSFPVGGHGAGLRDLTAAGERVFFLAFAEDTGRELWTSDGTVTGTRLVFDGGVEEGSSAPRQLTPAGGELVFLADSDDGGIRFWRTDGTAERTQRAGLGLHAPFELGRIGDEVIYTNTTFEVSEWGLWRSDGSLFGTVLLREGLFHATEFVQARDQIFFASHGHRGNELWITDGTPEDTRLVRDINPGFQPSQIIPCCYNSSWPHELLAVGSEIGFAAADAPNDRNVELWRSDGTEEGTRKVAEICPGDDCDAHPADLTYFRGRVYFSANDGESGRELWRTDGTAAGTQQVLDLRPGAQGSAPHDLFALGGRLFFFASRGTGDRLWTTDGSATGTFEIHSLVVERRPSWVSAVSAVSAQVFFVAANEATGPELWRTDGTADGTRLVRDLHAGPLGSYPGSLTPAGDGIVFAADDGESGREPWVSDGTADGTRRLADVQPGAPSSNPAGFAVVGSRLYFSADAPGSGRELWALAWDE